MIIDFLGIILAALFTIAKEFFEDRINKKWFKVGLLVLIIGSLFFSGIQIRSTNKAKDLSDIDNINLNKNIDTLKLNSYSVKNQYDTLLVQVKRTNNMLYPFIQIAKNRYPNKTDKDALDLLVSEIGNVKKSIEDAKIDSIVPKFIKQGNGVQAQLRFFLTNKNMRDKIKLEIYLPTNSQVDIINFDFLGTVGVANYADWISPDKKSAFISFNVIGSEIPSIGVNFSSYSQFLLKSNYLNNDIEIK